MLQQAESDDYVLATDESHSLREFVEGAFAHISRNIGVARQRCRRSGDGYKVEPAASLDRSAKEEKAFLAQFAKAAGAGELLNVQDLKAAYEKAIGHPTSNSTLQSSSPPRLAQVDAASLSSGPGSGGAKGL
jgi:hypothetical protein